MMQTLFIFGCLTLIFLGPKLLLWISASTSLPEIEILLLYALVQFLEGNHSNFAAFISSENKVPFMNSAIISAVAIILGCLFVLEYTELGVLGPILVVGVVQLAYSNWKWPIVVFKDFDIGLVEFLKLGYQRVVHVRKAI